MIRVKNVELIDMCIIAIKIVSDIRSYLAKTYNIIKGEHEEYKGLCDIAYSLFEKEINKFNDNLNFEVICFHGEQKHTPKIDPNNWYYEHTWIGLKEKNSNKILFIDPTSQQFKWLYDDIPDFYISDNPPKWYLNDKDNFFFKVYNKNKWIAKNIVNKFDYYIWGSICRIYRYFMIKNKEDN